MSYIVRNFYLDMSTDASFKYKNSTQNINTMYLVVCSNDTINPFISGPVFSVIFEIVGVKYFVGNQRLCQLAKRHAL